jgi:hypothetical protein
LKRSAIYPERVHIVALEGCWCITDHCVELLAIRIRPTPTMWIPAAALQPIGSARERVRVRDQLNTFVDARCAAQVHLPPG